MEKVKILLFTLMVALSVNLQARSIVRKNIEVYAASNHEKWRANLYDDKTAEITGIVEPTDRETLEIPYSVFIPQPHTLFAVTGVADSAFYKSKMKFSDLSLPRNLKRIGDLAFVGCSLERVAFSYGIEFGIAVFANCRNLRDASTWSLSPQMFFNCTSLTSVTLYGRIDKIADEAFNGCSSLTSFNFPSSLHYIGRYAFFETGLTAPDLSVISTDHVSIGPRAFSNCLNLTSVKLPTKTKSYELGEHAFAGCPKLGPDLVLENATLKNNVFYGCPGLTGILRLENCTFHGSEHFSGYKDFAKFRYLRADLLSLKQLKREQFAAALSKDKNYTMTLADGSVIEKMETIPDRFLAGMDILRGNIKFSPQLKGIGNYAFYNCGLAAKAADIRSSATIGDGVFRLAPNFTGDVVIPEAFGLRPYQDEWSGKLPFTISGITSIDLGNIENYCCPVNFQTAQESSPKPFRIGLRGFIFKKQAPNQIMMVLVVGI